MANTSLQFSIKSISIDEFATIKNCYNEQENIGIETGYGYGVNPDEHAVFVNFSIMFKCNESPFIILKVSCGFDIEPKDFTSLLITEQGKLLIPKSFLTHLTVLTVGTARGILYAKLEKSGFEQFILPTLNISDLIQEDMVFEVNPDL
jgi:hypothetical protein